MEIMEDWFLNMDEKTCKNAIVYLQSLIDKYGENCTLETSWDYDGLDYAFIDTNSTDS